MGFLAGVMIALGCIVYLKVGGVAGAILFSVGLMTVIAFDMKLFTGKVGLLASREIKYYNIIIILIENLVGVMLVAVTVLFTPLFSAITTPAAAIMAIRLGNSFVANIIYGIFCGLFMYIAVTGYKRTGSWLFAIFPVAVFILSGFNHCIADCFYWLISGVGPEGGIPLLATIIGNSVGGNIIPIVKRLEK